MENKHIIGFVVGMVIIVGIVVAVASYNTKSGPDLTLFAQCIKKSGTIFYGAFWCPHCAATKAMFGAAKSELPYVECSNPDRSPTQACIDKGVKEYPTWVFPDGSRLTGEHTLEELSARTNCPLPPEMGMTASSTPPTGSSSPASTSTSTVSASTTTSLHLASTSPLR